jgi:tRNA(adenine34) deaminase
MQLDCDRHFMQLALDLAQAARAAGEVPVGALVVLDGNVVGRGHNASIAETDPTAHAEIVALRRASLEVGNYRLVGSTVYCTVEPCLMCLGAMLHARVGRLVYGATEGRVGATSLLETIREQGASINHRFETVGGVMASEAAALLVDFFKERRGTEVVVTGAPRKRFVSVRRHVGSNPTLSAKTTVVQRLGLER